jgi:hypothetical protein
MASPDSAIPNSASPRPTTVSRPPSQAHTSGHGTEDCGSDGFEDGCCWAEDRGIGDCEAQNSGDGCCGGEEAEDGCREPEDLGTEKAGNGCCGTGDAWACGCWAVVSGTEDAGT